jgi:hypothetical protein
LQKLGLAIYSDIENLRRRSIEDFKFSRSTSCGSFRQPTERYKGDPCSRNTEKDQHVIPSSASGFGKNGLSISPHVFDIRERAQINNENLSEEEFLSCFEDGSIHRIDGAYRV